MSIAVVADVQRWLGGATFDADAIQDALDSAEDWVKQWSGYDWGRTGIVVERAANVLADGIIYLRDYDPEVLLVSIYSSSDLTVTPRPLLASEYQLITRGRVRLVFVNSYVPAGYDNVVSSALITTYPYVEVTYTAAGVVPAAVKTGTAMIAAADLLRSTRELAGLRSESIGDYSYTLQAGTDSSSNEGIPNAAMTKLRPYKRVAIRTVG